MRARFLTAFAVICLGCSSSPGNSDGGSVAGTTTGGNASGITGSAPTGTGTGTAHTSAGATTGAGRTSGTVTAGGTSGAARTGTSASGTTAAASATNGASNGGGHGSTGEASTGGEASGTGGTGPAPDSGVSATCPNAGGPCATADGTGYCCGEVCADTTSDSSNCGQCGAPCPTNAACSGGQCVNADGGTADCITLENDGNTSPCPAGFGCVYRQPPPEPGLPPFGPGLCLQASCAGKGDDLQCALAGFAYAGLCCGGACVDRTADAAHCGTCETGCDAGQLCLEASCTAAPACTASSASNQSCLSADGLTGSCCGATCTELQSDPANCGACGTTCKSGQSCVAGNCFYPDCSVAGAANGYCLLAGTGNVGICCASQCVDTFSDPANCGSCGNACTAGQSCAFSQTVGAECVDLSCAAGSWQTPCLSNGVLGMCCDTQCFTDTQTNADHCGGCTACQAGVQCSNGTCTEADCTVATENSYCAEGQGFCCGGSCIHFGSGDTNNCGGCGQICPAGETCNGDFGQCSSVYCSITAPCQAGYSCVNGGYCATASCAGVVDGQTCALPDGSSGQCCGGACAFTDFDANNCGACGRACPAQTECLSGDCIPQPCTPGAVGPECSTGTAMGYCCGASCTNTTQDPANCSECGAICPANTTCINGLCGTGNCAGDPADYPCPAGTACVFPETCGAESCAGLPNGYFCATAGQNGTCCDQTCILGSCP